MSKSTRGYPNSIRQIHSKCNIRGGGSYGITIGTYDLGVRVSAHFVDPSLSSAMVDILSPLKPVVGMYKLKQGIDSQLSTELGDRILSLPRSNLYFAGGTVRESPGREKCR